MEWTTEIKMDTYTTNAVINRSGNGSNGDNGDNDDGSSSIQFER